MTESIQRTTDLLGSVLADLAELVETTTPGQRRLPTPCTEFDVRRLLDHVVGWLTTFAAGFADPEGRAPRSDIDGYAAPADAGAEVRAAATQLDKALREGAAARPLRLGESAMPGELALGMILWEYQMHGWDLARATGRPWSPPEAAARESLAFAPAMLTADYQGEGKPFAAPVPVPDDAPAFDRLLGMSGRDPHWQPPA
ncbi:MAG TPA: TIGR03086 family metal-binding protein [Pseudonocardiaceae bacterium]|nr:TIGR03086 family metal-binding protein [Pseudonocardiaceae bacterium]